MNNRDAKRTAFEDNQKGQKELKELQDSILKAICDKKKIHDSYETEELRSAVNAFIKKHSIKILKITEETGFIKFFTRPRELNMQTFETYLRDFKLNNRK